MSARSVAASYKPPMLVTRARLPACALACASRQQLVLSYYFALTHIAGCVNKKTPSQLQTCTMARPNIVENTMCFYMFGGPPRAHGPFGLLVPTRRGRRPPHAIRTIYNIWMHAWVICAKLKRLYDTCGIRAHAGKPHRLSRPTP